MLLKPLRNRNSVVQQPFPDNDGPDFSTVRITQFSARGKIIQCKDENQTQHFTIVFIK